MLEHETTDAGIKGMASNAKASTSIIGSGMFTPAAFLDESSLRGNHQTLAEYCRRHGIALAPHVKTHMSPELTRIQLEGSIGVSVANSHQLFTVIEWGLRHVIVANLLLDPESLDRLMAMSSDDAELWVAVYVDSDESLRIVERAASDKGTVARVLVEFGVPGGRTGTPGVEAFRRVVEHVRTSKYLDLVGASAFEGIIRAPNPNERVSKVVTFLESFRDAVISIDTEDGFIVSAGGSAFIDPVTRILAQTGDGWQVVLRSGCYLIHDDGVYRDIAEVVPWVPAGSELRPALEVWGRVLSIPELGRAIVNLGKRDVGIEAGYPVPKHVIRHDDTGPVPLQGAATTGLNDQHLYLDLERGCDLAVGDVVGFGISHPCTTMDKWRVIPRVDDSGRLVGVAHTMF